jgi:hypothetical protein
MTKILDPNVFSLDWLFTSLRLADFFGVRSPASSSPLLLLDARD